MVESTQKWLVQINGKEQGPYSADDLRHKLASGEFQGRLPARKAEGGPWKRLDQIKELGPAPEDLSVLMEMKSLRASGDRTRTLTVDRSSIRKINQEVAHASKVAQSAHKQVEHYVPADTGLLKKLAIGVAVLALAGVAAYVINPDATKRTLGNMFGRMFSPIPNLPDVNGDAMSALREAASGDPKAGPKLAIAVSTNTPDQPIVYVASNLPDGAVIDIFIEGVRGTLIGAQKFEKTIYVELLKKFARTKPLPLAVGMAFPKGEYRLYASESDKQPDSTAMLLRAARPATGLPAFIPKNRKLFAVATVFIGGKVDGEYKSLLNVQKERTSREKAALMGSIKQIQSEIGKQVISLSAEADKSRGGRKRSPRDRAKLAFEKEWTAAQYNLDRKITSAITDLQKTGSSHLAIFQSAKAAAAAAGQAQAVWAGALNDSGLTDNRVDGALSEAKQALSNFDERVKQFEREAN